MPYSELDPDGPNGDRQVELSVLESRIKGVESAASAYRLRIARCKSEIEIYEKALSSVTEVAEYHNAIMEERVFSLCQC